MRRPIPTGLKTTSAKTNGHAHRKLGSWIDSFVQSTEGLESPSIFRKWAAITTIAATLEQRVWMRTSKGLLVPNIYCFLVAHPGVGKTTTISAAERYYLEIPEPHKAPTSLTGAALVDALVKAKRFIPTAKDPRDPEGKTPLDYNSMFITADEITAFMHKYDDEVIGIMSHFYDPREYGQWRRGNELKINVKYPQLNVLCGTTPSNLMKLMPENAWEQGFTSRVMMVFSDERIIGDDFAASVIDVSPDLIHDLRVIASAIGEYKVTLDYQTAVKQWRDAGEPPSPTHPKLLHYATRRRVHLFKLSMVSAIDRSDVLLLTKEDFDRALGWMTEAEATMADIFKAGAGNADAKAIDEIYHFVLTTCAGGRKIPAYRIINFAKARVPLHSVERVITVMEKSGLIKQAGLDPRQKNIVLYQPGTPPDDGIDVTPLMPGERLPTQRPN